jgi:hypothetical protein
MKIIEIKGANKYQKDVIIKTVEFCAERLNLKKRKFSLVVVLKDLTKKDYYGICSMNHDTKKKEILIQLEKTNTLMEMVRTVCHEMIHCKQYVKGELKEKYDASKNDWRYFWRGTEWTKKVLASEEGKYDLTKSPWEKEAYGRQMDLAMEAFIYNRL